MNAPPNPRPGEPHWTLPTQAGRTCPYCQTPLQDHEQVLVCPACRATHHLECWLDNGRCTTYGCREVAASGLWRRLERASQVLTVRLPRPTPRQETDTFDMATYTFALVFGWLFGPLVLMLSFDLRAYLRHHPDLPAPRLRGLRRLAWLGTAIGLIYVAVLVVGLVAFLLMLPHLAKGPVPGP